MRWIVVTVAIFAVVASAANSEEEDKNFVPRRSDKSSAPCVKALKDIFSEGTGKDASSCMSCDPALPKCPGKCQILIYEMYKQCEEVQLPPGYYFDPAQTVKGHWSDVKNELRLKVERCGCNSATASTPSFFATLLVVLVAAGVACGL